MRPTRQRLAALMCLSIAMVAGSTSHAVANWSTATGERSATYATATLRPATGLAATARCQLLAASVSLTWTASDSPQVTGYAILRRTSSTSYSTVATLSGRTTTSYDDATVTTGTTYTYVVRAVRNSWYVDSAPVDVTTPSICLV